MNLTQSGNEKFLSTGAVVLDTLKGIPEAVEEEIARPSVVSRHNKFLGRDAQETMNLYKDVIIRAAVILCYCSLGLIYYTSKEKWDFQETMYFIITMIVGVGNGNFVPTSGL